MFLVCGGMSSATVLSVYRQEFHIHDSFEITKHAWLFLQARLKLTYWPPPSGDMINAMDPNTPIMEIQPSAMPSAGVFLAYRVPVPGHPDTVELPSGSLIKVPIACAREGYLKLTVTGPPGQQHELIARALLDETPAPIEQDSPETAVRLNPPGRRVTWQLSGLASLHAAHACDMGDEVCIERYARRSCP